MCEAASGKARITMDLEDPIPNFAIEPDRRPRVPEPPPVRLVTIDDAHLIAMAGVERELDVFYLRILKFEREAGSIYPVYCAENFRLIFDVHEPPVARDDLRPLGIEVPSLLSIEQRLIEAKMEYTRVRSLMPAHESLVLLDPAGNWIEISESHPIG
jgi:hypothetical protein